ncbi:hypothetical protein N7495_006040 [Penicillium taxi]|uniref:uncharacterized protein n=1 Tax=Penicillium taxi TaxID=168475 RepID=UPI0025459517|nr:uncharacterized protein N7495_006040 [Penicillium taxi]KAJ5894349.1 hypothetical protein N7495_006040 [Penicillium taxi]
MESPSRSHLTGVKEEPYSRGSIEEHYFQNSDYAFNIEEPYFPMDPTDTYDLHDMAMEATEKRQSDSASYKGVSRISSHISTISTRWKKRGSAGSPERETFQDILRSRANSAASSAFASSTVASSITRIDSIPPSPVRTIFEERMSSSGTLPIDITRANSLSQDDDQPKATTPLLPPFMGDESPRVMASRVQSPLQSPSVADISDSGCDVDPAQRFAAIVGIPSPPLSSKPSLVSMSRARANTIRTVSGDVTPFVLSDPNDEWANKLGHANFTIQPEPYVPATCDIESFQQLRSDWNIARCNFAKHLVRTGEHYGVTSKIYKLTGEKWESISREWSMLHTAMLSELGSVGVALTLTHSNTLPCEQLRIPGLHDNAKFPEMGDEDIVGPMTVAPATETMKKRNFFKFFQDLVSRS